MTQDDPLLDDEELMDEASGEWKRDDKLLGHSGDEIQDAAEAFIAKIIDATTDGKTESIEKLRQVAVSAALDINRSEIYDGPPGFRLQEAPKTLSQTERLPLPWDEINKRIMGGIPVGEPVAIMGTTSGGKSLILSAQAAKLIQEGKTVLRIDWENDGEMNLAEVVAILNELPSGSRIEDPYTAYRKWRKDNPDAGEYLHYDPRDYPGEDVNCPKIQDIVAQWEEELGKPVDALLIDYYDYLSDDALYQKYRSEFIVQDKIFMQLWSYAKRTRKGLYVLVQSNRSGFAEAEKDGTLDPSKVGGSWGKIMKAPFVITVVKNAVKSTTTIEFWKARGADRLIGTKVKLDYNSISSPAGSRGYLSYASIESKRQLRALIHKWEESQQSATVTDMFLNQTPSSIIGAIIHNTGKWKGRLIVPKDTFLNFIGGKEEYQGVVISDLRKRKIIGKGAEGRGPCLYQIRRSGKAKDYYVFNIPEGHPVEEVSI